MLSSIPRTRLKMKRGPIIIVGILFSLFTPFFTIIPVQAIGVGYSEYWFFISETGIIDFPEMAFSVHNTQDEPVAILCSYETIEGVDINITFDWQRIDLAVNEKAYNHYSINISSKFSATFYMRIYVSQKPAGSADSQLAAGGIVVNRITYYSETDGALLDLQIMDQSDAPHEAVVDLEYQVNSSMPFTPIKHFNGTSFYGILPKGRYHLRASDLDSDVFAETTFDLYNETKLTAVLRLVGFNQFSPMEIVERKGYSNLGVNCSVNNFVGLLENLEIYAELYFEGEKISTTEPFTISELDRTPAFRFSIWFSPLKWQRGVYQIKGLIESGNQLIAEEWSDKIIPTQFADTSPSLEVILLGLSILVIFGMAIWIIKGEVKKRANLT